MANNEDKKVYKLPKLPSMNFGKKSLGFGITSGQKGPGKTFVPPTFRVTQNKGSGGK